MLYSKWLNSIIKTKYLEINKIRFQIINYIKCQIKKTNIYVYDELKILHIVAISICLNDSHDLLIKLKTIATKFDWL